jgi:hypothetical protein
LIPSRAEESILRVLLDQPFFPIVQLRKYHGMNPFTWNKAISDLQMMGLIRKYNAHHPELNAQWVLALSPKALEFLAEREGFDRATLMKRHSYQQGRLIWLAAVLRRVILSRIFFQWLSGHEKKLPQPAPEPSAEIETEATWDWKLVSWDVEVMIQYRRARSIRRIPFSGAATFENRLTHAWDWMLLEMDRSQVAVQAEYRRLSEFIAAQTDPEFGNGAGQKPFPALAILAADEYRMNEYELLIRRASFAKRQSVPSIYITTWDSLIKARRNPRAPVWYSTKLDGWTPLLSAEEGSGTPDEEPLWERRFGGDLVVPKKSLRSARYRRTSRLEKHFMTWRHFH